MGLRRVLVANRGEIAVRIVRACFDEGVESVAAVSDADLDSLAARRADGVVRIGPAAAECSYLHVPSIVAAAIATGCDGLHPGYGFLSERPQLAQACAEAGIAFVGPPADVIARGGSKIEARALARSADVPVGDGSDRAGTAEEALAAAQQIGYPVLLKASAGGGGRGMVRVGSDDELRSGFATASNEAQAAFGDGTLFVERFVDRARHVEVQVLADTHGSVVHLGERDCSAQRRYQKIMEEAPAASLPPSLRTQMCDAAVRLAREMDYVGAGTVEFLVDSDVVGGCSGDGATRGSFSFLEVNTRVQVEHPVTEMVTGIDIVREQLRIAAGEPLSFTQDDVVPRGNAVEVRLNAEDPVSGFLPSPGRISRWTVPEGDGVRCDTFCHDGAEVVPHYDSLLAKLVCWAPDRANALDKVDRTLARTRIEGVDTTTALQRALVRHGDVRDDKIHTRWIEETFLPGWTASRATPA